MNLATCLLMKNMVTGYSRMVSNGKVNLVKYWHGLLQKKFSLPILKPGLYKALENPAASSCAEDGLLRVLKKYDPHKPGIYFVEELPPDSLFKVKGGKTFSKGNKVRKRFLCKEISTGKLFLFSPVAEVELVNGGEWAIGNGQWAIINPILLRIIFKEFQPLPAPCLDKYIFTSSRGFWRKIFCRKKSGAPAYLAIYFHNKIDCSLKNYKMIGSFIKINVPFLLR